MPLYLYLKTEQGLHALWFLKNTRNFIFLSEKAFSNMPDVYLVISKTRFFI